MLFMNVFIFIGMFSYECVNIHMNVFSYYIECVLSPGVLPGPVRVRTARGACDVNGRRV